MIEVTRLDNSTVLINVDKIQSLHSAPETVITFTNKVKMMVREPVDEVTKRIMDYQRLLHKSQMIEPGILEDFSNTIQ